MAAVEISEDISDLLGAEKPTFETIALAAGYRVFPCAPDKSPRIKGWQRNATTDPAVIAAWSRQWPAAMVGVPTGEAQGLFVLDVDVKGNVDGFASLKALGITLPVTRTHRTRSGGLHYLFKFPKGENLTISAGKLGEGLDTRGNGGYVIWPGSPGYTVENDAPIADMPRDLLALLKQRKAPATTTTTTTAGAPAPRWPPETVAMALKPLVQRMAYRAFPPSAIEAAIRAEAPADCLDDALPLVPADGAYQSPAIPETTRDTVLTSMGGSMRAIGWSVGAILAALLVVDEAQCQPPKGRHEVERITRSVTTYERGFVAKPLKYGEGWITSDPSGVRYHEGAQEMRICGELRKLAMASDADDGQYAILVGWKSINGKQHRQAIPREALLGEGIEARRILTAGGLDIAPGKKAHALLVAYLTIGHPRARALSVEKLGWHNGRFVLPEETIGDAEAEVIFQSNGTVSPAMSVSGEVADWRASVARLAVGNSRLLFAISAALAGPLLEVAGEPGGGFHLRGGSSIGKTTALVAAASVWGKPRDFIRSWHATANGLEAVAALHNDGVMILDEIGEADPKTIGKTAYALSNGKGKARMSAGITARKALEWRLIYLSSGEESFRALAEREGGKVHAGQDIRLADIPADAGAGLGLFESLHGLPSPGDLAKALGNPEHYGAVGQAWLRHVVAERERLTPALRKGMDEIVALWTPPEANGQVQRVARRFALVAMAGELATEAGLTGWPAGTATWGAGQCFEAWREGFTQGSDLPHEERALLEHVRGFFERHGDSRFQQVAARGEEPDTDFSDLVSEATDDAGPADTWHVNNRVGFREKRAGHDGFDFFVLASAMAEVCGTADVRNATKVLGKHRWIERKEQGRLDGKKKVEGQSYRGYFFTPKVWET